ncbi:MAG: hypothetical protein JXA21_27745 [Anaerolineae bacterium]|nr:hypothetical protein [Anaerolineae bacterium]
MKILQAAFASFLRQMPLYLIWAVGIILALKYWDTYPKTALLTVVALAIFFVQALVSNVLNVWLPQKALSKEMSAKQVSSVVSARGIVSLIVSTIAWGLLIAAIFVERG